MIFLAVVLLVILREKLKNAFITYYGIILAVIGMCIFNIGLTYGLAKLGDQSGGLIAGAFTSIDAITASPLYSMTVGVGIAGLFMEVHPDPENALSDGPNAWPLELLDDLIRNLQELDVLVKARFPSEIDV